MVQGFWQSIATLIGRRYVQVVIAVLVVTAVCAIGIPRLKFETSQDTLIGKNTRVAQQSRKYQKEFGGEAMLVLYTGPAAKLATPANQKRFLDIEAKLRKTGLFDSVISPRTAIDLANAQIPVGPAIFASAEKAYPDKKAALQTRLSSELARLQAAGPQTFTNPKYVQFLLHEQDGTIRSALQDNFPDDHHGLMIVRLKGNASIADIGKAADASRKIVEANKIPGFTVLASGSPLLLKDINDYLQGGLATLGALAVGVMFVVLIVVWRRRWRLLSLFCVLVGIAGAFGLMGWLGIPLNLVTISGFPILIGMGVDFAIQMHSRFEEELDEDQRVDGVLQRVMGHLGPALAVALVAAMVGFVALQISKVPMIKQFGVMLDLGVAVLFLCVIFLPLALLTWRENRSPTSPKTRVQTHGALERFVRTLATVATHWVVPMLLIGSVIVVAGFWAEGRFTIQTDPEKWIPQGGSTVHSLDALREGTGFSTELDFFVSADDVTKTQNAAWLQRFVEAEIQKHKGEIIHGSSFGNIETTLTHQLPTQGGINTLLGVTNNPKNQLTDIPKAFYSADKTKANVVFPIANISLTQRKALLDSIKNDLKSPQLKPPHGVDAEPYGLVVIGIALVDALQSNRDVMTLLALALVAAWLLVFYRNLTKTVLTLVPVLLAVGASSLAVYATGLELSPLTAVSGPLVIAVCTEFAILIMSRYVEERGNGLTPEGAVDLGTVRIGRAFIASGLTLIGGFAVMALSSFPLLRDFGIIVALNAVVALSCALIVLPPLLVAADRHPRITGFQPGGEGLGGPGVGDADVDDPERRAGRSPAID
jgi:hydrophobe/amphiphile efflux-3 (HAE3) family protein